MKKGKIYRVEGFAYSGNGNEISRVEISLNGGNDWLYCVRKVSILAHEYSVRVPCYQVLIIMLLVP